MRKKPRKPEGRVGIEVWGEGEDVQIPPTTFENRISRSSYTASNNRECCNYNGECLLTDASVIDDDFVVWDCN